MFSGDYQGRGTNHEGQEFQGTLSLALLLNGAGVAIQFKATGNDGTVFHEEHTVIAPNLRGDICLYNLNTNMPGLVEHTLSRYETTTEGVEVGVFAFGQRADKQAFREEITVELRPSGSIAYKYAWGMPSGDFADRSGVVLNLV